MSESLDTRRKALEDQFFAQQDQKLLEQLREREAVQAALDALRSASGISDEAVLNELVGLGIRSDTLAALSLIPLVAVAWADGVMETKERKAILSAAAEVGVEAGDVSHQLLGRWLDSRPGRALVDAWRDYIHGLLEHLDPVAHAALKHELLGRARQVAEAAGGFLGVGNKVSREEEDVLAELERAFS